MSPRSLLVVTLSSVLGAAALATAPFAVAGDDDGVARGACSQNAFKRLRVVPDGNGRFDVIGVVWSNDDDLWDWRMTHDGDLSFKGEVRADGDSDRSFRIKRSMLDFPGIDNIAFKAENNRTGETCFVKVDDF